MTTRASFSVLIGLCAAAIVRGETPLTLENATALALAHSRAGLIADARRDEANASRREAESRRYPSLLGFGYYGHDFERLDYTVNKGSLDRIVDEVAVGAGFDPLTPDYGPFPAENVTLIRGSRNRYVVGLTLMQPLTQQFRIHSGIVAARADDKHAQIEFAQTRARLRYAVEQLFAGLAAENAFREAAAAKVRAREARLRDAENARLSGEVLDAVVLGAQAELTQARTELVRIEQKIVEYRLQLADLLGRNAAGLPPLALDSLPARNERPLEDWLAASSLHYDARLAATVVEKARAGVSASKQKNIPDLSLFVSGSRQEGVPLIPRDYTSAGLLLNWEIFDFGGKKAGVARSLAQQRQASLNHERVREDAAREIHLAHLQFSHARELVALSAEAEIFRQRAHAVRRQASEQGEVLASEALTAESDWLQARAEHTAARLQQHLTLLKLYFLTGGLDE